MLQCIAMHPVPSCIQILYQMLPINISVLAMDFAGCGKSEGQYISLGYFESDDIACAVEYCRSAFGVSKIGMLR